MKSAYSLQSICQECNKTHLHNDFVITSINLDADIDVTKNLFNFKLNNIRCPFCESEYTFETNLVIYSPSLNFAIKVNPEMCHCEQFDPAQVPAFIFPKDFKFRQVAFQIEAIEKCRIFTDNLDDICIELLKYKCFTDEDTLPFDEVNMVYSSCDKENLYFTKYDYNNRFLGDFQISRSLYDESIKSTHLLNKNIWHCINRKTINQYIQDKER